MPIGLPLCDGMKIAQIGLADTWSKKYAKALSESGVLSAVCDPNKETIYDDTIIQNLQKHGDIPRYHTIDELVSSQQFDAAVVCAPVHTRAEITSQLLDAKKHVLVQFPVDYDSNTVQQLVDLANKRRMVLFIGGPQPINRFNISANKVKDLIESKTYGELVALHLYGLHKEVYSPPPSPSPKSQQQNIYNDNNNNILDIIVSDLDVVLWLLDQRPNVVFARVGQTSNDTVRQHDFTFIMLGFTNNKTVTISADRTSSKTTESHISVDIMCTDAIVSADFTLQQIRIRKYVDRWTNYSSTSLPSQPIESSPMQLEIQQFIDTIKKRNDVSSPSSILSSPPSSQRAANITRIAEAALLSSQKGTNIYLELK